MMKRIVAVSLLLLSFRTAHAQFGETVEVRVTNVEVIVTDKAGKPVPGLTKEDFEVYENGVVQEITNFGEIGQQVPSGTLTAVAADTPAAEPVARDIRRRLISIVIDNASLDTGNRAAVLPLLRQFLANNVRPGDGIAIYSWGDSLNVQLEPTSDPTAIAAAVDKLASRTAKIGSWRQDFHNEIDTLIAAYKGRNPPEKPAMRDALSTAYGYAARGSSDMRQKVAALKSVIASLRGIEGRKVLVLLTESLSTNPAEETFHYLHSIRQEFAGGENLNPFAESRGYNLNGMANELSAAA
ncbi:MAG TPA: VWA domain-containing protein, partial [Thermoanaerobaculia bacterium]